MLETLQNLIKDLKVLGVYRKYENFLDRLELLLEYIDRKRDDYE